MLRFGAVFDLFGEFLGAETIENGAETIKKGAETIENGGETIENGAERRHPSARFELSFWIGRKY